MILTPFLKVDATRPRMRLSMIQSTALSISTIKQYIRIQVTGLTTIHGGPREPR